LEGRSSDRRRVSDCAASYQSGEATLGQMPDLKGVGLGALRRIDHRAQYPPFQVATVPIPEVNDVRPTPFHSNLLAA
jgi:hypothetical protein